MNTMNRRIEIINILIIRRHTTANELAQELGVSIRTIQYDIQALSPQYPIEQNRCAMACQGCGAVLFLLKSSGITFHNPLLLSYHTKQLN